VKVHWSRPIDGRTNPCRQKGEFEFLITDPLPMAIRTLKGRVRSHVLRLRSRSLRERASVEKKKAYFLSLPGRTVPIAAQRLLYCGFFIEVFLAGQADKNTLAFLTAYEKISCRMSILLYAIFRMRGAVYRTIYDE
jgi:hypothetical protein